MNAFKSLDTLFPTIPNRVFGEVVSVDIQLTLDGEYLDDISMKRKAWYVNASTNAYHMHRSLVRDFTEATRKVKLSHEAKKRAKRLIALGVLIGYIGNRESGGQYWSFNLHLTGCETELNRKRSGLAYLPHMWLMEVGSEELGVQWEVVARDLSLQAEVDVSVSLCAERLERRRVEGLLHNARV